LKEQFQDQNKTN